MKIVHEENDGTTDANLADVGPLARGMIEVDPESELVLVDQEVWDEDVLDDLPEWLAELCREGHDALLAQKKEDRRAKKPVKKATKKPSADEDLDDEIPEAAE